METAWMRSKSRWRTNSTRRYCLVRVNASDTIGATFRPIKWIVGISISYSQRMEVPACRFIRPWGFRLRIRWKWGIMVVRPRRGRKNKASKVTTKERKKFLLLRTTNRMERALLWRYWLSSSSIHPPASKVNKESCTNSSVKKSSNN